MKRYVATRPVPFWKRITKEQLVDGFILAVIFGAIGVLLGYGF